MIAKLLLIPFVLIIVALVWFGRGNFFKGNLPVPTPIVNPTETTIPVVTAVPTVVPTTLPNEVSISSDWKTYTNSDYGFSISYPKDYKALTSKDDLYGWPHAVVLLYAGGQAYDVVIEVWDTESDYKNAHVGQELLVTEVNGKFITVLDQTLNAETQEIISTFLLTK